MVDENGTILEMKIANHGSNYSYDPSIVASDPHCMCNMKVRNCFNTSILDSRTYFSLLVNSLGILLGLWIPVSHLTDLVEAGTGIT
jgi:hypothetical protein